jgi:hypothetical protein
MGVDWLTPWENINRSCIGIMVRQYTETIMEDEEKSSLFFLNIKRGLPWVDMAADL